MTSEAPRRVSVKDLAREIEARRLESTDSSRNDAAPGGANGRKRRSLTPARENLTRARNEIPDTDSLLGLKTSQDGGQRLAFLNVECSTRRSSEGDIFLRCKPRKSGPSYESGGSSPPEVPPRRRQASLEDEFLRIRFDSDAVHQECNLASPSLRQVAEEDEECSGTVETQVRAPTKGGLSKTVSLKSGSSTWVEGTAPPPPPSPLPARDVGEAIFRSRCCNSAPAPFQNSILSGTSVAKNNSNPLEEIIASLERICEEFDAAGATGQSFEQSGFDNTDPSIDKNDTQREGLTKNESLFVVIDGRGRDRDAIADSAESVPNLVPRLAGRDNEVYEGKVTSDGQKNIAHASKEGDANQFDGIDERKLGILTIDLEKVKNARQNHVDERKCLENSFVTPIHLTSSKTNFLKDAEISKESSSSTEVGRNDAINLDVSSEGKHNINGSEKDPRLPEKADLRQETFDLGAEDREKTSKSIKIISQVAISKDRLGTEGKSNSTLIIDSNGTASEPISPVLYSLSPNRRQVRQKPNLPSYLSLSRKSLVDTSEKVELIAKVKRSGSLGGEPPAPSSSSFGIEEAKAILAGLDFGKYRRRKKNADHGKSLNVDSDIQDTAMASSTKSLKTRSPKTSNAKLKDLFEMLKLNPDSTKRVRKNHSLCRSSSFSNAEDIDDAPAFLLENRRDDISDQLRDSSRGDDVDGTCKTATLPKRKKPFHRPAKASSTPAVPAITSSPKISRLDSENSGPKSEPDEGLVSDSEAGSGAYVKAYVSCVASPPTSKRNFIRRCSGHVRSASDDVTALAATQALTSGEIVAKPGSSLELSSGTSPPTPDKRKRRKGIGSMTCGPPTGHHGNSGQEPAKSGTGRSLTYPPQRKTSVPEETQVYSSVDSNGLKSLKIHSSGLLDPSQDEHRLLSDLSLADSHLCPSEGLAEETYQDIVDSVMRSPDDQHLSVEDRNMAGNGKLPKKKHHSDPGGDVSSGVSGESVVFMPDMMIGSSRSEPDLGTNDATITSSSSSSSSSSNQHPSSSSHHHEDDDGHLRLEVEAHSGSEPPSVARTLPHGPKHTRVGSTGSNRFQFDIDSDRHRLGTEFAGSKSPQEQRRYSKRRLRGPYGEMLEEEMRKSGEKLKPNFNELNFLQEICESTKKQSKRPSGADTAPVTNSRPVIFSSSQSLDDGTSIKSDDVASAAPKRKVSANYPLLDATMADSAHIDTSSIKRSSSSCSQDSSSSVSEQRSMVHKDNNSVHSSQNGLTEFPKMGEKYSDTRTHVVGELYDTEKSYVESLQILANKYMKPLKSPDYSGVVDTGLVDEIFFQIPEILNHHETFLEELRLRLSNWDGKQKVGDVFVEAFTKQHVIDTYTAFINNWKSAKDAIKIASQAKPAFARFLEHMTREHKGKLTLDALLIMPVQRIPRYELLIKELLKHTHVDHPDHRLLVAAQREVHELALKINRMEREAFQHEQMQQKVKDIEQIIDGVVELVQPDRGFIRHDMVHMPGGLGTKKERCLFLFSDLLIISSMKRKSGTMRKPSAAGSGSPSSYNSLEMNKYKLLTKFSLDNLDITRSTDTSFRRLLKDIEHMEEDVALLHQITELTANINSPHQGLDEAVKELVSNITKQLAEKQNADSQLVSLEMTVTIQEGIESLTILFSSPERRATWEAAFNDAKQKLALSTDRRPPPEFMHPLPIRKTRAGLQFTCATATLGLNQQGLRDVWVCNSDGYVGQVCVLSLQPEPTVMSCNGVCNARILTIASIPAAAASAHPEKTRWRPTMPDNLTGVSIEVEECDEDYEEQRTNNGNIQLDSDSSEEEDESESPDDEKMREEGRKTRGGSIPREDGYDDMDHRQPTMWLGTEDGCIHVYNCNDNIRTKKNKIKIQHMAAIHCIIYLDNRVFAALANGEVHIYKKDPAGGGWSSSEPQKVQVGSVASPVTKMLAVAGKLWCGCQNNIKVVNTLTLQTEHSFSVSSDNTRTVLCMVTSGLGVWTVLQHSAVLRLFHATSYECLLDVNVAPAVTKMLSGCDDIIRQHKAACLRVTAVLACKDLLWIGTSAGVVLTLPLPHLTSTTTRLDSTPNVAGLPHGHTGHVRFLTCVEMSPSMSSLDGKVSRALRNKESGTTSRRASTATSAGYKLLVISGGDGYEDFRNCGLGEAAGRDDSTNHLLLWQV